MDRRGVFAESEVDEDLDDDKDEPFCMLSQM